MTTPAARARIATEWPASEKKQMHRSAVMTYYGGVAEETLELKRARLQAMVARFQEGLVPETVTYFVGQAEVCPSSGREHLQMYAEFSSAKSYTAIQAIFGPPKQPLEGMHIEKRRGTAKQASDYCKKIETAIAETQWEIGTMTHQGVTENITTACAMLKQGASLAEVAEEFPREYVTHGFGLERYAKAIYKPIKYEDDMKIEWIWGDSGTLKSRWIEHLHGEENIGEFAGLGGGQPWFNYVRDQHALAFNEIQEEVFSPKYQPMMLRWTGDNKVDLPVKKGFERRQVSHIYVTSNWDPAKVLAGESQERIAIRRRFHVIEWRQKIPETPEEEAERKFGTYLVFIQRMKINRRGAYTPYAVDGKYVVDEEDWSMTPYDVWMQKREIAQYDYDRRKQDLGTSEEAALELLGPRPKGPRLLLNERGKPCPEQLAEQAKSRAVSLAARGI